MKTLTKLASLMMVSAGLIAAPIASAKPAPHKPHAAKPAPKKHNVKKPAAKKHAPARHANHRAPR